MEGHFCWDKTLNGDHKVTPMGRAAPLFRSSLFAKKRSAAALSRREPPLQSAARTAESSPDEVGKLLLAKSEESEKRKARGVQTTKHRTAAPIIDPASLKML